MRISLRKRSDNNLRKLVKVGNDEQDNIIVRIEEVDGNVLTNGTPITEEILETINFKDDNEMVIKNSGSNILPASLLGKTQITALSDGSIWIIPALGLGDPFVVSVSETDNNDYVTESELAEKGYVTNSSLTAKNYVTRSEMQGENYLKSEDLPELNENPQSVSRNLALLNMPTQTKNGITCSINKDFLVTTTGTATSYFEMFVASDLRIYPGTYTLKFILISGNPVWSSFNVYAEDASGSRVRFSDDGNMAVYSKTFTANYPVTKIIISGSAASNINGLKFKLQIEKGTEYTWFKNPVGLGQELLLGEYLNGNTLPGNIFQAFGTKVKIRMEIVSGQLETCLSGERILDALDFTESSQYSLTVSGYEGSNTSSGFLCARYELGYHTVSVLRNGSYTSSYPVRFYATKMEE